MPLDFLKGHYLNLLSRLQGFEGGEPSASQANSARRAAAALEAASRSAVETLEDRVLLSSYYVSTGGNDSNAGNSLSASFRSIQRAANIAKPGDTVFIRSGTYRETVKPANSGVTFKAYNGERVTVSGANVVSGWSSYKNSIYKAPMGWDEGFGQNQVFVDGKMMIEARWPNTSIDISRPAKATMDSASGSTITDADLKQFPSGFWNGATIHQVPGMAWFGQTGKVTSSSPGKLNISYERMSGEETIRGGNKYYLTGKFQALDAPGEWFRNSDGQLYLRTLGGDSPSKHVVEAKQRDYAFDLRGKDNTRIEGIDIFAATITTDGGSSGNVIRDADIKYVGHFTWMPNRQQPFQESILLAGSNNTIADSRIQGAAGSAIVLQGSGNRVENCLVVDTNYNAGSASAIRAFGSNHTITRNTIYNSGRDGIKFSDATRLKITYNDIHTVMLQTMDGGGLYTFGENGNGTEIAYNTIHDIHSGGLGATGIMLDNGSSNYVVHHNAVWDADFGMKMNTSSKYNKVVNNTLLGRHSSISGSRERNFTGTIVRNNIFNARVDLNSTAKQSNNINGATSSLFVNLGGDNLMPRAGSAAINKGTSVAPYTNGYAGSAPDIGAYEYGRSAFRAGANQSIPSIPVPSAPSAPDPDPTPAPKPTPAPTPAPSTGSGRDAKGTIQGESFTSAGGAKKSDSGTSVAYLDGGDWVQYKGLNFGTGVSTFTANVSAIKSGGVIEIRSGSRTGTLHGSLTIKSTGSWNRYTQQSTTVKNLSGVKDLYFVVRGGASVGKIDWFKFSGGSSTSSSGGSTPTPTTPSTTAKRSARTTIQVEKNDGTRGVREHFAGVDQTHTGDWVKLSGVDFGSGVSSVQVRLGVEDGHGGGVIEIRTGSPTGTLRGSLVTKVTRDWWNFATQTASVSGLKGVQDVYLVFRGNGVANVDWIKFA
jgi:hypothetical protein